MSDDELSRAIRLFSDLLMSAHAVVCARSSPKQKAKLVGLVKKRNKTVLAVGDGANDVNMLSEASVGVGIFGEEGIQAVQVSDFAIGSFRHLWKLIFVHGRWNNLRIGKFINYFIYKNIVFTLPQFIYGFYNLFSGNPLYDGKYLASNLVGRMLTMSS